MSGTSGSTGRKRRVHVLASVDAPNRDWAATLPEGSTDDASWDRRFKYASLRRPAGIANEVSQHMQPLQVIRVHTRSERVRLESQVPSFMKVVFVESPAQPRRFLR